MPTKVVSSPSVVVNLLKTRQFRPKRNRPQKRFSGFDTPSKCVSPNIIRALVKSAAQKTGKVQLLFPQNQAHYSKYFHILAMTFCTNCDLQPQMLYCNVRCTDASSGVANLVSGSSDFPWNLAFSGSKPVVSPPKARFRAKLRHADPGPCV